MKTVKESRGTYVHMTEDGARFTSPWVSSWIPLIPQSSWRGWMQTLWSGVWTVNNFKTIYFEGIFFYLDRTCVERGKKGGWHAIIALRLDWGCFCYCTSCMHALIYMCQSRPHACIHFLQLAGLLWWCLYWFCIICYAESKRLIDLAR